MFIFNLIKSNPWVFVGLAAAFFLSGLYVGNRICAERNTNAVIDLYQTGNESATGLEKQKAETEKNKREIVYVKKSIGGDCLVDAKRVSVLNAALSNDTRLINK